MKKVFIVVPTYNEASNIERLISKIYNVSKQIKDYDINVLIVDDNSPDKTWQIVKTISKKNKKVRLLVRKHKSGLGRAYIEGFKYIFKNFKSDVIIQMDADLSHDPKEIISMLSYIDKNYDVVIGSRYVDGGKILNWGPIRKLTTSGFRAFKTSILKKVNFDKLNVHGYAFLTNLLFEVYKNGNRIKEIPITFLDRQYGDSKLSKKDMLEFLINCFRLRFRV